MAFSISVIAIACSLNLIAFVLAVGAERRRSTGKVVPDKYDVYTYCQYDSDASTVYGLSAFLLALISQLLVHGVTRCLCCGKGLTPGSARSCAVCFFVFSWSFVDQTAQQFLKPRVHLVFPSRPDARHNERVFFLVAEACLLAGSAKNAYHTKYRARFHAEHLTCSALRKGVFAAGAAMVLLSMVVSLLFYSSYAKANTGGWQRHHNEGMGMSTYQSTDDAGTQKL